MTSLYLASGSPRRQQLLTQLGYDFEVVKPTVDESPLAGESPVRLVMRLAQTKAQAGLELIKEDDVVNPRVLGSDTIVVLDDVVLGKPIDRDDAYRTLQLLSGQEHKVMTAVALVSSAQSQEVLVVTKVQFCSLSEALISRYLATGEYADKAGSYGIQGFGGNFVRAIQGSYSAVVGLPLVETRELIESFDISGKL